MPAPTLGGTVKRMIDDDTSNPNPSANESRRHGVTRRVALGTAAALTATQISASTPRGRSAQPMPDDRFVSPERYGALGDGVADDTPALQAALDTGRSIRLAHGRHYLVRSTLRVASDDILLTGGGRIKIARDFRLTGGVSSSLKVIVVEGEQATFDGITFDASEAPQGSAVENGIIWSDKPSTTVRNCLFLNNPKGTAVWILGNSPYSIVTNCRFLNCTGAVFAKGRNPVITNNVVIDATDAAIAINGRSCVGAIITGNSISNEKLIPIPSMIAVEESASNWTIVGNTLTGVNGGGIICTNVLDSTVVRGGVIADNVIDGHRFDGRASKTKNPAALLYVSPSYTDWIVHDNRISNCPTGNSNSRLIIIPATGGIFHDNIVDGSSNAELSAMITILPGRNGITISNNITKAADGGRHFLFSPGDYGNVACTFIHGRLYGGSEGINAELGSKDHHGLVLQIHDIADSSVGNIVNAATILGDRAALLNAGGWAWPHRLGVHTVMYGDKIPVHAGKMPFQPGDRFHFITPLRGKPTGVIRLADGWAGLAMIT